MKKFKLISILLMSLTLILCSESMQAFSSNGASKVKVVTKNKLTYVDNDIIVSQGDYYKVNLTLVVSKDKQATVIDTGYSLTEAKRILEYIKKNKLKLKNIIITHMHADHTNCLEQFYANDSIHMYSYDNTKNNQVIKMGNQTFKIIFTPGHADNEHFSVEIVNKKILVAGDVVLNDMPDSLNYGGNCTKLISTLEKLKKNTYECIIPGHGSVITDSKVGIDRQLSYLKKLKATIQSYLKAHKDATKIKLSDCMSDTSFLDKTRTNEVERMHNENIGIIINELGK